MTLVTEMLEESAEAIFTITTMINFTYHFTGFKVSRRLRGAELVVTESTSQIRSDTIVVMTSQDLVNLGCIKKFNEPTSALQIDTISA